LALAGEDDDYQELDNNPVYNNDDSNNNAVDKDIPHDKDEQW